MASIPAEETAHAAPVVASKRTWHFWASVGVLCFYIFLALPAGVYGCINLFQHLNFADFSPSSNSVLGRSNHYKNWYGWRACVEHPVYIELQASPRGEACNDGVRAVETYLLTDIGMQELSKQRLYPNVVSDVRAYYLPGYQNDSYIAGINNDTMLLMLNWLPEGAKPYVNSIEDFLQSSYFITSGRYTARVSGMPQLLQAMKDDVLENMGMIDAICIPLGLILFVVALRTSPWTIVVPLVTLPMSLILGLGLASPLHHSMKITAFAPEMMASVVVALSIDFALFLISRIAEFREEETCEDAERGSDEMEEEMPQPRSPKHVIIPKAFAQVSHNILVSGIAITAAFGGLCLIDNEFVRSCALVAAIGSATTTVVSTTLLPAVVFLLYGIIFAPLPLCVRKAWKRSVRSLSCHLQQLRKGRVDEATVPLTGLRACKAQSRCVAQHRKNDFNSPLASAAGRAALHLSPPLVLGGVV